MRVMSICAFFRVSVPPLESENIVYLWVGVELLLRFKVYPCFVCNSYVFPITEFISVLENVFVRQSYTFVST